MSLIPRRLAWRLSCRIWSRPHVVMTVLPAMSSVVSVMTVTLRVREDQCMLQIDGR